MRKVLNQKNTERGLNLLSLKRRFLRKQTLSCLPQGKTVKLIQQLREQSEKLNAL
jgi:hypothetical protein